MAEVVFIGIPNSLAQNMAAAFELIASGKRSGSIDEDALKAVLGPLHQQKFISTKEESEFWLAKWKENPAIEAPWDFGSWVDAFMNAEIAFQEIHLSIDGAGSIVFDQLAYPSGGLEAIEQLVKVFGGAVVSNSAI